MDNLSLMNKSEKEDIILSVVLPAYNCSDTLELRLPKLISYLNNLGVKYEIVVVDDGSEDQGKIAKVTKQLGCIYIRNSTNKGKGAAVRTGMLHARGRYRIYTDADIPFKLITIERFLWYLDFKEFHMVIGDRTLEGSSYFDDVPKLRQIGSQFMSFIVGRFMVGGLFDTQCGIKGYRDHVAIDLFGVSRINRFAFDVEILYIALKRNYDIKRLPVCLEYQGNSSVKVIRDSLVIMRDLFLIRWYQLQKHYQPGTPIIRSIDSYQRSFYEEK